MPRIEMRQAALEFCRDAVSRQIEATHDEPDICDQGVAHEIAFLRSCASNLGTDLDGIVSESAREAVSQRLATGLRGRQPGGIPWTTRRHLTGGLVLESCEG